MKNFFGYLVDALGTPSKQPLFSPAQLEEGIAGLAAIDANGNMVMPNGSVVPAAQALAAPTITTTITVLTPTLRLVPPATLSTLAGLLQGSGIWVDKLNISYQWIGTLVSPDLAGSINEIDFNANTIMTSMSFPALIATGEISVNNNSALESFEAPLLQVVSGQLAIRYSNSLTAVDLSALKVVGAIYLGDLAALTSFALPAIVSFGGFWDEEVGGLGALESFTLGATLKECTGNVVFGSTSEAILNEASVDNILVRLAALDGTNGTVIYGGRTVNLAGTCAAPSAAGLAAKVVLEARMCTVTVTPQLP